MTEILLAMPTAWQPALINQTDSVLSNRDKALVSAFCDLMDNLFEQWRVISCGQCIGFPVLITDRIPGVEDRQCSMYSIECQLWPAAEGCDDQRLVSEQETRGRIMDLFAQMRSIRS